MRRAIGLRVPAGPGLGNAVPPLEPAAARQVGDQPGRRAPPPPSSPPSPPAPGRSGCRGTCLGVRTPTTSRPTSASSGGTTVFKAAMAASSQRATWRPTTRRVTKQPGPRPRGAPARPRSSRRCSAGPRRWVTTRADSGAMRGRAGPGATRLHDPGRRGPAWWLRGPELRPRRPRPATADPGPTHDHHRWPPPPVPPWPGAPAPTGCSAAPCMSR